MVAGRFNQEFDLLGWFSKGRGWKKISPNLPSPRTLCSSPNATKGMSTTVDDSWPCFAGFGFGVFNPALSE
jgi:hypothetical protein